MNVSRITINEVARLSGVSKKTVSRVINHSPLLSEATRSKVEAVIAETGYVPDPQARALARGRNFSIALIHDGTSPAILALIEQGIHEALEGGDYALVLRALAGDPETRLAEFLERHRPAGVLLVPPLSGNPALAARCLAADTPCVRLGVSAPDDPACFAADERAAMAETVDALVRAGHRRIGLIAGPEHSRESRQRELGYLDAMADHELDRGPALIANGDYSLDSGVAAGRLLLEVSPRPTAIIACNDVMAAGVIRAACAMGIAVPEDLSVIGFGDEPLAAQVTPPLTSVHVPWTQMARAAAERLVDPGAAPLPPRYVPHLIARESASAIETSQ
ncbi:LacI family DNA-binding transcriptional regulator [Novosphingobium album (ex Liu et al. 2023)]|uniref:LacI family DNA-binding transcriptional regulator n=1 Tax=Novosphingobium album (ex Liu et al. 2023) TaxID=3031130 RepID=A0ABT5WTS7_9SPHN|nr:LacI family DNA-binding transcriptional regulator [Novosphingobium album (ex Liu et al. 2023)]MDE8653292.1 LacI family DNA-binding transcriptional regulator [Novosphingobium album (ex Liu et al. 2023)]